MIKINREKVVIKTKYFGLFIYDGKLDRLRIGKCKGLHIII